MKRLLLILALILIAPVQADDWNRGWRKNVVGSLIPEVPLCGKIDGARFELIQTKAVHRTITFHGKQNRQTVKLIFLKEKKLGGQDLKIKPGDTHTGTHIRVEWVDEQGQTQNESYMSGYSLRFKLDHPSGGKPAKGGLYLTLPDKKKSLLKGEFEVEI